MQILSSHCSKNCVDQIFSLSFRAGSAASAPRSPAAMAGMRVTNKYTSAQNIPPIVTDSFSLQAIGRGISPVQAQFLGGPKLTSSSASLLPSPYLNLASSLPGPGKSAAAASVATSSDIFSSLDGLGQSFDANFGSQLGIPGLVDGMGR